MGIAVGGLIGGTAMATNGISEPLHVTLSTIAGAQLAYGIGAVLQRGDAS